MLKPEPVERSYREKVAWISLMTTVVLYVPYFILVGRGLLHGELSWPQMFALLSGLILLQALLLPIGLLAGWLLGQRAPNLPADERDRAIDARATRASYYTLIALGFSLPFALFSVQPSLLGSPAALLQGFFFCFVVAQMVGFALQVLGYRRGF